MTNSQQLCLQCICTYDHPSETLLHQHQLCGHKIMYLRLLPAKLILKVNTFLRLLLWTIYV